MGTFGLRRAEIKEELKVMERKRYWRVRAITDETGTHPDIPEGINWVGNTDGEVYVIVTSPDVDLSGHPGVEELSFEEAARALQQITDLPGDDVGEKWGVST